MSTVTTARLSTTLAGTLLLATEPAFAMHALPAELIERILTFSDPRDVSRFARTCRFAYQLIYEAKDQFLWRELYLSCPFDDLRSAIPVPRGRPHEEGLPRDQKDTAQEIQWKAELQRRTHAELIATSGTRDAHLLQTAYETFLAVTNTSSPLVKDQRGKTAASSGDVSDATARSENLRWLDRVLRETRVLDRVPAWAGAIVDIPSFELLKCEPTKLRSGRTLESAATPSVVLGPGTVRTLRSEDEEEAAAGAAMLDIADVCWIPERFRAAHQMRCRLRAYVALSYESSTEPASVARMAKLRRASRTFVYDMRKYEERTLWGPYRLGADGRTVLANWEHVEHILNVVSTKLREVPLTSLGYYRKPLFQMDALRAYSAIGSAERPAGDWAGITGTWRRFVCFMDYRDLYMFNYSLLPPGPHDPTFFDDPFDEAVRPVELHLMLISREEYYSERDRVAHDPSVRFTAETDDDDGTSPIGDYEDPAFPTLYFKGDSHGAAATVRGKVSTLSDGAIRWQFVTTYDGRMQWSAEAVQIGHACSAAGVAGIWTGAHHNHDDPAGPFWMMKVSDRLPEGILNILH